MGLGDHYRLDPPCLIHCQSIHEHSEPADSVSEKWTPQTNSSGGMKRVGNVQVQQKKGFYHLSYPILSMPEVPVVAMHWLTRLSVAPIF